MQHNFLVTWIIIAFTLFPMSAIAEISIELCERLNQSFDCELIAVPIRNAKDGFRPGPVTGAGPEGPVTAQAISAVEDPEGKAGQVVFVITGLKPLTSKRFTFNLEQRPSTSSPELKIDLGTSQVEISTPLVAVRLPIGEEKFSPSVPWSRAPVPFRGMRLVQGPWTGPATLAGDAPVSAWTSRLIASGPVLARVETVYTFTAGHKVRLVTEVLAGDSAIRMELFSQQDQPSLAMNLPLAGVHGLTECLSPKAWGGWSRERKVPLVADKPFIFLGPDSSLVNAHTDTSPNLVFGPKDGLEMQIRSRDPGAWVDPAKPLTYGGFGPWNLDMIGQSWERWQRKRIPLSYQAVDGVVTMKVDLAAGRRKWSISKGAPLVGERLNIVKDYVLDWPRGAQESHPRLFLRRSDLEAAWKKMATDPRPAGPLPPSTGPLSPLVQVYIRSGGKKEVAEQVGLVKNLRDLLGKYGDFDTLRLGIATAVLYDLLIDTDLVSSSERSLFRSQLAALGYAMADSSMWSIERGYHTGNPNMSLAMVLTLGVIAATIPEHPMAKTWGDYASAWMDKWLADEVGPNGEWLPEGAHYGCQVSLSTILAYVLAAKHAGVRDFSVDPRLKKLILFFAKQYTPADPRRKNVRGSPPVGRGMAADVSAAFGIASRLSAVNDTEFSRTIQWLWKSAGFPMEVGDTRLAGFEPVILDPSLPATPPAWSSECFPALGAIFRDGVGQTEEHYLNLLAYVDSLRNLDIWTPGIGGITCWFAYGQPLSQAFTFGTGYFERHELLRDGVLLARNFDGTEKGKSPFGYYTRTAFGAFAALPSLDYARASYQVTKPDDRAWFPEKMPTWPVVKAATEPHLNWTRQALYFKDSTLSGPHWLLLRDTTEGGQPTEWQFWAFTQKIGTPEQVRDPKFLADAPGENSQPAHALPPGNRYTGIGQFGVDVEYFVAAPVQSPRHTLRYGAKTFHATEFQDLLHLQLPGDGVYYVAIFPHPHAQEAPTFTTLDGGKIIKISGAFGTDYGFLTTESSTATGDEARFNGTSGGVQIRSQFIQLALGAAGEVRHGEYSVAAKNNASLRVDKEGLTITVTPTPHAQEVRVSAPGKWATKGATIQESKADGITLSIPAGITMVRLKQL
jgi:hypothetical protein